MTHTHHIWPNWPHLSWKLGHKHWSLIHLSENTNAQFLNVSPNLEIDLFGSPQESLHRKGFVKGCVEALKHLHLGLERNLRSVWNLKMVLVCRPSDLLTMGIRWPGRKFDHFIKPCMHSHQVPSNLDDTVWSIIHKVLWTHSHWGTGYHPVDSTNILLVIHTHSACEWQTGGMTLQQLCLPSWWGYYIAW